MKQHAEIKNFIACLIKLLYFYFSHKALLLCWMDSLKKVRLLS